MSPNRPFIESDWRNEINRRVELSAKEIEICGEIRRAEIQHRQMATDVWQIGVIRFG
jgi:hypothetical protein